LPTTTYQSKNTPQFWTSILGRPHPTAHHDDPPGQQSGEQ
jgi:hypothetical protein